MLTSRFKKFYNSIIKEDSSIGIDVDVDAMNKKEQATKVKDKKSEKSSDKAVEDESGVKTLEKDFLDKFIRYNELQMLMKDLPEIANSFKSIQGFDEQLIRDTVEKLVSERTKEIETLTKDLTALRDKITKEAEVANYKKSIIDIFDKQSGDLANKGNSKYAYGYVSAQDKDAQDNGEAYNNGQTLAGKDGVPTVSVGMPEVTDNGPMEQPEKLPSNNAGPSEIEDLRQAEDNGADVIAATEKPIPVPKKRVSKKDISPLLIDSKKKKVTKKRK